MKVSVLLITLVALIGLCGSVEAFLIPGTAELIAIEDAMVDSGFSLMNYGDEEVLAIQGTGTVFPLGSLQEIYLKFDLSSIPDEAIVTSAVFGIYLFEAYEGFAAVPTHASLHYVDEDSWVESDVTWNTKPAFEPDHIDEEWEMAITPSEDVRVFEWDLFSDKGGSTWSNHENDLAADVISLMLKVSVDDEVENNFAKYNSSEAASYQPYLNITYVPEPVTIALLGFGGLFLRRRK